jgi:hypothetical protein
MLQKRLNAARTVADALGPAETDIETAIASTGRLITAIVDARREAGVAISLGQDSLGALGKTLEDLVAARGNIIVAHAALAEDRIGAGLSAYGMGDVSDCPPAEGSIKPAEAQIRSVA